MKTITIIMIGILSCLAFASFASALTIDSVQVYPEQIMPGESGKVTIYLENNLDSDIENVQVSLDLSSVPFAPYDSSAQQNIDEIKESRTESFSFQIQALATADSGVYKIPVKIDYSDEDGVKQPQESSIISVTVQAKPIIGVSLEDGLFLKGQNNAIRVKVVNKGLANIKFLEVEVASSTIYTLLSQKNVYIGDIDSNDFDTADFQIFVKGTAPNTINIPVTISYKDALDKEYQEDFSLPLKAYTQAQAIQLGLIKKSNTAFYIIAIIALIIIWIIYRRIMKRRKMKASSP